jgi:hypothetical protein
MSRASTTLAGVKSVVACTACGELLSAPLVQIDPIPAPQRLHYDPDTYGYKPTVPVGRWAIDPEPVSRRGDISGPPTNTLGCLVINPADALPLLPHSDGRRSGGCCGHDGLDGPNLLCPNCRVAVATLRDDCWTPVETRFEPHLVTLVAIE